MSWLNFLTEGAGPGVDLAWVTQAVNAVRYRTPPPATAPNGAVSGMRERDRLVEDLYREVWDLKLCVAALVVVATRAGAATREELAALVERLALGYDPAEGPGPAPDEPNPFAVLG